MSRKSLDQTDWPEEPANITGEPENINLTSLTKEIRSSNWTQRVDFEMINWRYPVSRRCLGNLKFKFWTSNEVDKQCFLNIPGGKGKDEEHRIAATSVSGKKTFEIVGQIERDK